MPHPIVDCWELTLAARDSAERRGFRVGAGRRAVGVSVVGGPIDSPTGDAVLWRRCTSPEGASDWLEGGRAPAAPWAMRTALSRVAAGYVYPDPDVPGSWFATRRPQADPWGQDRGPFATRQAACLSLLGGGSPTPSSGKAATSPGEDDVLSDRMRERVLEAALRAPIPSELLDEARWAEDGWEALRGAWPEVASLPLSPLLVRQVAGRILLLAELELVDPDAADREAAGVVDALTCLLREWASGGDGGADVVGHAMRSHLWSAAHRAVGLTRRAWNGPERTSWYQLEERHLALQVGRLAAVVGTAAAALLATHQGVLTGGYEVAIVSAVAFATHLALLIAPLRRASLLRVAVDASLILDAVWVTLAALGSGGSGSPLVGLYGLAAIAATLVYSPRTGVKAAMLASLGVLVLDWYDDGSVWTPSSAVLLLALWTLVAIVAGGVGIGERELRRRADRLGVLHGAGSELLGISDPDELREVAQTAAERLLPGWRASLRRGPAPDRPRLGREGDEALIAVPVTDGTAPIGVIECRRPRRVSRPRESVRARELQSLEALATALGTALSRAELIEALSTQSSTDSLTGLANRRSFDAEIARSLAGLRRHGRPISLCLVDVDHFKRFNDSHGHVEGDRALIEVARVLGQQVRGSDLAARYGGEEFALLLPDTELDVAFHVAERVRAAVARSSVPQGPVTVSIGLATAIEGCLPEELIAAADGALYAAKAGGRNRVEAADAPLTGPD